MLSRLSTLGSLLGFMVQGNRKYWLLPLVIALTFVIVFLVIASASPVFAFLYPLF